MSDVSLAKGSESFGTTTKSLMRIEAEIRERVKGLKHIVVKINFVNANKPLATTPIETVRAFIEFVRRYYKGKIIIAEEATFGSTEGGFQKYGFNQLTKDYSDVEVYDAGKSESENLRIGLLNIPLARIYTKSPFVVSITRAKTHNAVVVTLGIKNLIVGAIKHGIFKNRFKIHITGINKIMTQIGRHVWPDLVIIDGTAGMEGDGPADGTLINAGWVVASHDALAGDSLAAYLMGFDYRDIGYFNLMRDEGLGKIYGLDKVQVVGEDPAKLIKKFEPSPTFEKQRKWR
jgi:uncharacterized protein (DUF362 family)